jgi:hypothetical protein
VVTSIFVFLVIIHLLDRFLCLLIYIIPLRRLRLRTEISVVVRPHDLYIFLRECGFDERCGGEEGVVLIHRERDALCTSVVGPKKEYEETAYLLPRLSLSGISEIVLPDVDERAVVVALDRDASLAARVQLVLSLISIFNSEE